MYVQLLDQVYHVAYKVRKQELYSADTHQVFRTMRHVSTIIIIVRPVLFRSILLSEEQLADLSEQENFVVATMSKQLQSKILLCSWLRWPLLKSRIAADLK